MITVVMPAAVLIITFPVALIVPSMVLNTPPSVIPVPATLALGVQFMPSVNGLPAVSAIPVDRLVEPGLRPFYVPLALLPSVRLRTRHRDEQQKHTQHRASDQGFSESFVISPCVHGFPPVHECVKLVGQSLYFDPTVLTLYPRAFRSGNQFPGGVPVFGERSPADNRIDCARRRG